MGRQVLFWTFVGVEVILLFRFIMFPLFKQKFQKGIIGFDNYQEHFADVNDSLTNFLQLSDSDISRINLNCYWLR
jgi:hypothetical protein